MPPIMPTLVRGALRRCPRCGRGKLFRRWFFLPSHCPTCGLAFERKEGAFLGSMSINYSIAGVLGFAMMIVGLIAGWSLAPLMAACFGVVAASLALFFPLSKTLWAAIELLLTTPADVEPDARDFRPN